MVSTWVKGLKLQGWRKESLIFFTIGLFGCLEQLWSYALVSNVYTYCIYSKFLRFLFLGEYLKSWSKEYSALEEYSRFIVLDKELFCPKGVL